MAGSPHGGTPKEAITELAVQTRLALGPVVPTLRRLTRAPSISSTIEFGEQIRLRRAGRFAQLGQPIALLDFEILDHLEPRVTFFGEFHRRIGEVAAALILDDRLGDELDEAIELTDRIARVLRLDRRPILLVFRPL